MVLFYLILWFISIVSGIIIWDSNVVISLFFYFISFLFMIMSSYHYFLNKKVKELSEVISAFPVASVYSVYGVPDTYYYYSEGVTREFGENKLIKLNSGETILSVVQPINEYQKANLPVIGTLLIGKE